MQARLTPTSFIILGLVRWSPNATAYDLERTITGTVSHMWAVQRSQIYREPSRLEAAGYLVGRTSSDGRQKTRYTITPAGEEELDKWLAQPAGELPQLRDLAILKVFFDADPVAIAQVRVLAHQARLKQYEALLGAVGTARPGPQRTLDAAITHERASIRFWNSLAKGEDSTDTP